MKKINYKRVVPIILSVLSSIGVITTVVLTVEDTNKYSEKHKSTVKKDFKDAKTKSDKLQVIKETAKSYIPAIRS